MGPPMRATNAKHPSSIAVLTMQIRRTFIHLPTTSLSVRTYETGQMSQKSYSA